MLKPVKGPKPPRKVLVFRESTVATGVAEPEPGGSSLGVDCRLLLPSSTLESVKRSEGGFFEGPWRVDVKEEATEKRGVITGISMSSLRVKSRFLRLGRVCRTSNARKLRSIDRKSVV